MGCEPVSGRSGSLESVGRSVQWGHLAGILTKTAQRRHDARGQSIGRRERKRKREGWGALGQAAATDPRCKIRVLGNTTLLRQARSQSGPWQLAPLGPPTPLPLLLLLLPDRLPPPSPPCSPRAYGLSPRPDAAVQQSAALRTRPTFRTVVRRSLRMPACFHAGVQSKRQRVGEKHRKPKV